MKLRYRYHTELKYVLTEKNVFWCKRRSHRWFKTNAHREDRRNAKVLIAEALTQ